MDREASGLILPLPVVVWLNHLRSHPITIGCFVGNGAAEVLDLVGTRPRPPLARSTPVTYLRRCYRRDWAVLPLYVGFVFEIESFKYR